MNIKRLSYFPPFSTVVIFILLTLIGILLIPKLNLHLLPYRSSASITVVCAFPRASAEVIETKVCSQLESGLASLRGVIQLSSVSSDGHCEIRVDLDKWTDPEKFRFEASLILRQLHKSLPKDVSYPEIFVKKIDHEQRTSSMIYVLKGSGNLDQTVRFSELNLRPALSNVAGVKQIDIEGVNKEYLRIATNLSSLTRYGISFEKLKAELQKGLRISRFEYNEINVESFLILLVSDYDTIEKLSEFPINTGSGRIVRLKELAQIERLRKEQQSYYRINGHEMIKINITPYDEINSKSFSKHVRSEIAKLQKILPPGYQLILKYDSSLLIEKEINKVIIRTSLSIFILLVFVVLITKRMHYIIIVVLSLLANVAISFILFYLFRIEIHLYSIAGIALALGLVVDNSIIVIDDLRHTGRNNVFSSVLASTIISIGALSVIFFLEDEQRILLLDFALVININLVVSLPIIYLLLPAVLDLFPSKIETKKRTIKKLKMAVFISKFYKTFLRTIVRYRFSFYIIFILSFGLPLFLLPQKLEENNTFDKIYNKTFGSDFYNVTVREYINKYLGGTLFLFASADWRDSQRAEENLRTQTQIMIHIKMVRGASIEQMNNIVQNLERYLSRFESEISTVESFVYSGTNARLIVSFKQDKNSLFPNELKERLEIESNQEGAAEFEIYGVGNAFSNVFNNERYDSSISLKGYNYNELQQIAIQLQDSLKNNQRVRDILISSMDRFDVRKVDEYLFELNNSRKLNFYNIGNTDVRLGLQSYMSSENYLGYIFNKYGFPLDINLEYNINQSPDIWQLMNHSTTVKDSSDMHFNELGVFKTIQASEGIVRRNQEYILKVHYRFIGSYEQDLHLQAHLISYFKKKLPLGFNIYPSNYENKWTAESNSRYLWLILLSFVIIYFIGAIMFESLSIPFFIILIIPFSFIGVFVTFYIFRLNLNAGSYAAMLMVGALVTNNALFIINDISLLQQIRRNKIADKIWIYDRAFQMKIVPILITTSAALISLLPFMMNGEENGFWFALSAGTIGGLIFSILGIFIMLPLCFINPIFSKAKLIGEETR